MRKAMLIGIFLALIFISACIRQEAKFENNGIKITQFTANPTEVSERQEVEFALEIENVGSTTASGVMAELINTRNIWGGGTSAKSVGNMRPSSLKDNTPGDIKFFQWILTAPDLPEGVAAPLEVKARVTYDYSSTQVIRVTAINTNQKRILDSRGEVIVNPIVVAQDDFSPIKIFIAKGPAPLIIDPTDPISEVTYRLEIKNVGGGWPITSNKIGLVAGRIDVKGSGISMHDCSGGSGDFNSAGATLRSDATAPVICTLAIDKSSWAAGPKEDSFLFIIDLRYRYFVEESVTVTVHGRDGGGAGGTPSGGGGTSGGTPSGGTPSGPSGGTGLTLCGLPVADQTTYNKCLSALNRKGGDCNGNWCVATDVSDEFCCITQTCRDGYANGGTIEIERSSICVT